MGQINPLFWHFASTQTKLKISPVWRSPEGHLAQDRLIFLISLPIIYLYLFILMIFVQYKSDKHLIYSTLFKPFSNKLWQSLPVVLKTYDNIDIVNVLWVNCFLYDYNNKMKQQGEQIIPDQQAAQSEQDPQAKKARIKKIVIKVLVVIFAVICFCLSIVAMSAAVVYFSYMFSIMGELLAKAYLQQHYAWFMAITYMAIFGFVIVVANTAVFFTQFSQKERIIWIHIIFYLAMFICGIVALAGDSSYSTQMSVKTASGCNPSTDVQCQLSLPYLTFRGQVSSYFIGYCICFFAYAGLYQYASYTEKRQKQEKARQNLQFNHSQSDANKVAKNNSSLSFENQN